jgi:hypothetical protein
MEVIIVGGCLLCSRCRLRDHHCAADRGDRRLLAHVTMSRKNSGTDMAIMTSNGDLMKRIKRAVFLTLLLAEKV